MPFGSPLLSALLKHLFDSFHALHPGLRYLVQQTVSSIYIHLHVSILKHDLLQILQGLHRDPYNWPPASLRVLVLQVSVI